MQYSGHYSHFKSIFSIENSVNSHFQMAIMLWGKGLWQICMHHWTVHEKVDFPKFSTRYPAGGVYSTMFSQLLILNTEMKDLH